MLPLVISVSSDCAGYLDLFSSLQGYGDAGPEGKEGQGFDGGQPPAGASGTPLVVLSSLDNSPQHNPQRKFITHPSSMCVGGSPQWLLLLQSSSCNHGKVSAKGSYPQHTVMRGE